MHVCVLNVSYRCDTATLKLKKQQQFGYFECKSVKHLLIYVFYIYLPRAQALWQQQCHVKAI